jgi:hypothetical protein
MLEKKKEHGGKEMIHLSFPPEGGRAAEAFQSLFSHTDGKIRDGYGKNGCGRKVVGTERLIYWPSILLICDMGHTMMRWCGETSEKNPHQIRRHRG